MPNTQTSGFFSVTNDLLALSQAWSEMNHAAVEVVVRRSMMMAQGRMGIGEAMGMVTEKYIAAATGMGEATLLASQGARPDVVAKAAMSPLGLKAEANVRRLRD